MMQALLRLSIVEPIVQVEMPEQMPQLEFIPTIPLPQEITLNATANFNTLEVAKIGYQRATFGEREYGFDQDGVIVWTDLCFSLPETGKPLMQCFQNFLFIRWYEMPAV